jgi:hypothetical protein
VPVGKKVDGSGSISHWYGSGDPDPLVIGTDPGIRICTKMSRIPNTDIQDFSKEYEYAVALAPLELNRELRAHAFPKNMLLTISKTIRSSGGTHELLSW